MQKRPEIVACIFLVSGLGTPGEILLIALYSNGVLVRALMIRLDVPSLETSGLCQPHKIKDAHNHSSFAGFL